MPYEREIEMAIQSARQAGRCIMERYETFIRIPDAPANITTDADRESQELILQALLAAFPADALCAEEQTPTLAAAAHTGDRVWVVDPIDGTRGFAQKNGQFSVMIALLDHGQPAVGVVLEPALDRLTWAVRQAGCWRQDAGGPVIACRVSQTTDLKAATLVQSHSKPGVVSRQAQALATAHVDETHSAGVKLARVARGEADLYVNHYPNFHDWDVCAGHILVEEAGGRVTGLHGQPIHYGGSSASQRLGMLATNGKLHDAVVARLRTVF